MVSAAVIAVVVAGVLMHDPVMQPSQFRLGVIDRGPLTTVVTASGTVEPVTSVEVSSQLSGQISELFVDFNDPVVEGQPLARLDPRTFQAKVREAEAELALARTESRTQMAAVAQARAQLQRSRAEARVARETTASDKALTEVARLQLERKRKLQSRKIVAGSDADEAKATHQSKQAQLRAAFAKEGVGQAGIQAAQTALDVEKTKLDNVKSAIKLKETKVATAQIELDRTVIRSPIDGVVIKRNVKLGQTVAASLRAPKLFTIAEDLRLMEVETSVDEADIGRVKLGQRAEFTVDAYVGKVFTGRIDEIRKAPETFQNVVTYTVVITADNAGLALFPGMTASVKIIVGEVTDAVRIPNAALRFTPKTAGPPDRFHPASGKGRIWILGSDNNPEPVVLNLGITDSVLTEMRSGPLKNGAKVIVGEVPQIDSSVFAELKLLVKGVPFLQDLKAAFQR